MPDMYVATAAAKDACAAARPIVFRVCGSGVPAAGRVRSRLVAVLVAIAAPVAVSLALFPGAAAADSCPNAAFRIGLSAGLLDCRAYEHVTPVDKEGFHAVAVAISDDGNTAIFDSRGVLAGNPNPAPVNSTYVAHRTSSGWVAESVVPPLGEGTINPGVSAGDVAGYTPDMKTFLFDYEQGVTAVGQDGLTGFRLFLREPDGTLHVASPLLQGPGGGAPGSEVGSPDAPEPFGQSSDLSNLVLESPEGPLQVTAGPADPVAGAGTHLYEVFGANTSSPGVRLVTLDPSGTPFPAGGTLGGPTGFSATSAFHAISSDGSRIFFTATPTGGVQSVWARTDGSSTTAISEPSPNPQCTTSACTGATLEPAGFQGASADGSKVFFTTSQPLVDADTDTTNDLYEYDFSQPAGQSLIQVSGGDATDPTPGSGAGVLGVVRISDDGSHVYFVATGLLTTTPNAEGQIAQQGADNLYLYEQDAANPAGRTVFIGDLCSGADTSGSVATTSCPGSGSDAALWGSDSARQAQTTSDGRFLVFTTFAQLTSDDTDTAQDVYLYDSQTGAATRISQGVDGGDDNGNDNAFNASIHVLNVSTTAVPTVEQTSRAVTNDGSTVIFTTAEPLSSDDVNGATDLYEWHAGQVALVSDGQASTGLPLAATAVITPSGNDILFDSTDPLTEDDNDGGLDDVYDARVDGGFPFTPAATACATGATCEGGATPAPAPSPVGTVTFTGPGNQQPAAPSQPTPTPTPNPKPKLKPATGKVKASGKTVTGARFALRVKIPSKGRVTITGPSVRKVSRTFAKAGTKELTVRLTKNAEKLLKRKRRMKIRVKVAYKPAAGKSSSVSVPVTVKA